VLFLNFLSCIWSKIIEKQVFYAKNFFLTIFQRRFQKHKKYCKINRYRDRDRDRPSP
jgi:hypothetical protein